MQLTIYNLKGKTDNKLTLPADLFGQKINQQLLALAVKVYLSNQRQAPAKAKTRGEVHLSGQKIYRQKGTGRARHGDKKAPIFVKGGKAHGPTGEQNYKLKLSHKQKRLALISALSQKAKDKQIAIIDGLEKISTKTKIFKKTLKLIYQAKTLPKTAVILPLVLDNVIKAGRNISQVKFLQAANLNTYEILNTEELLITKPSIEILKNVYMSKKKAIKNEH